MIPTLSREQGEKTAKAALLMSGFKLGEKPDLFAVVSHDEREEGFSRTVNRGIAIADAQHPGSDICLLNDDIRAFQYAWLREMYRVLYLNDSYGLSCPGGKSGAMPMASASVGLEGVQVVDQASFWCVLLKRKMMNSDPRLHRLDEDMRHYCSDNWYCFVMKQLGWKCAWARSIVLDHKHHGSGLKSKWRKKDRAVFFSKIAAAKREVRKA